MAHHDIETTLDAGRYRYGAEKLCLAVSYAATAAGDARARLEGTFSQLFVLRPEHLPPEVWEKISRVLARLTSGDGVVANNTWRMKNATASKLLKDVWDAYKIVERAYQDDTHR